jgi:membrane protease YdiL (CAAX protease family)
LDDASRLGGIAALGVAEFGGHAQHGQQAHSAASSPEKLPERLEDVRHGTAPRSVLRQLIPASARSQARAGSLLPGGPTSIIFDQLTSRAAVTDDPDEPVELYRARSAAEAHALRTELDDAGIAAQVDSELLQGIVGEVPGGWVTAPRVLVKRHHLDAARTVLDEFLSRAEDPADAPADAELRCLACRTPMGTGDTCPACGWSYAPDHRPDPAPAVPAPRKVEAPLPSEATAAPAPDPIPSVPSQPRWGEVAAVLAVGVVPYLFALLPGPRQVAPPPYWADAIQLSGTSACIAFVTLYLIRRSGEPWGRFGLDRPAGTDVLLGIGMLIVAELVWILESRLGLPSSNYPFIGPRGSTELALMLVAHAANGFTEELVTRAYLITRLEALLRSRGWAVVLAAAAFASYHAYQGPAGLVGNFLFGLAYGVAYLSIRRVWPLAVGHALFNIHLDLLYPPVG